MQQSGEQFDWPELQGTQQQQQQAQQQHYQFIPPPAQGYDQSYEMPVRHMQHQHGSSGQRRLHPLGTGRRDQPIAMSMDTEEPAGAGYGQQSSSAYGGVVEEPQNSHQYAHQPHHQQQQRRVGPSREPQHFTMERGGLPPVGPTGGIIETSSGLMTEEDEKQSRQREAMRRLSEPRKPKMQHHLPSINPTAGAADRRKVKARHVQAGVRGGVYDGEQYGGPQQHGHTFEARRDHHHHDHSYEEGEPQQQVYYTPQPKQQRQHRVPPIANDRHSVQEAQLREQRLAQIAAHTQQKYHREVFDQDEAPMSGGDESNPRSPNNGGSKLTSPPRRGRSSSVPKLPPIHDGASDGSHSEQQQEMGSGDVGGVLSRGVNRDPSPTSLVKAERRAIAAKREKRANNNRKSSVSIDHHNTGTGTSPTPLDEEFADRQSKARAVEKRLEEVIQIRQEMGLKRGGENRHNGKSRSPLLDRRRSTGSTHTPTQQQHQQDDLQPGLDKHKRQYDARQRKHEEEMRRILQEMDMQRSRVELVLRHSEMNAKQLQHDREALRNHLAVEDDFSQQHGHRSDLLGRGRAAPVTAAVRKDPEVLELERKVKEYQREQKRQQKERAEAIEARRQRTEAARKAKEEERKQVKLAEAAARRERNAKWAKWEPTRHANDRTRIWVRERATVVLQAYCRARASWTAAATKHHLNLIGVKNDPSLETAEVDDMPMPQPLEHLSPPPKHRVQLHSSSPHSKGSSPTPHHPSSSASRSSVMRSNLKASRVTPSPAPMVMSLNPDLVAVDSNSTTSTTAAGLSAATRARSKPQKPSPEKKTHDRKSSESPSTGRGSTSPSSHHSRSPSTGRSVADATTASSRSKRVESRSPSRNSDGGKTPKKRKSSSTTSSPSQSPSKGEQQPATTPLDGDDEDTLRTASASIVANEVASDVLLAAAAAMRELHHEEEGNPIEEVAGGASEEREDELKNGDSSEQIATELIAAAFEAAIGEPLPVHHRPTPPSGARRPSHPENRSVSSMLYDSRALSELE